MLITNSDDYRSVLTKLESHTPDDVLAIDTETTGLHIYGEDHITGLSLTDRSGSVYVPINHVESLNFPLKPIVKALSESKALHVYHHGIFDWGVLQEGSGGRFKVPERLWETMVVDWLMDENQRHGLKDVGARVFGTDAKEEQQALKKIMRGRNYTELYKELRATDEWGKPNPAAPAREEARRQVAASKKTWATLTAEDIAPYAEMDTKLTYDLQTYQVTELNDPWDSDVDVRPDLEREFQFQRVLYKMIRTGITVDPVGADVHRSHALARIHEIEREFDGTAIGSTQQLARLIYAKWGLHSPHVTRGGAQSTSKATLEELEGQHPGIELILEWRKLTKAVGTYYDGLLAKIGNDGRIHSAFNSARTVTGRLSSSDPNLQNIPRPDTNPEVRSVFVPETGMELWEYDLSQAELRVGAGFANEEAMMSAIAEGRDLHGEVAASIWGPDYTSLQRRLAKNLNFGFQYGIGPRKFATYLVQGTGRPVTQAHVDQAADILDGYRRTFPALTRLMSGMQRAADEYGYVPLHVPGRYRRFRGPGYSVPTYSALNAIVQGGVAEFLKDVMIELDGEIGQYGRVCLQIHDSLVIEVDPGAGPVVGKLLQRIADDLNPFRMPQVFEAKEWKPE